jgi:hypothetical protein
VTDAISVGNKEQTHFSASSLTQSAAQPRENNSLALCSSLFCHFSQILNFLSCAIPEKKFDAQDVKLTKT